MKEMSITIELFVKECVYEGCGISYAVPKEWDKYRREDHKSFYCPNGHRHYYPGKTRVEKLMEQLGILRNDHERCVAKLEEKDRRIKSLKRSRGQYKGRLEKLTAKPEESE